MPKYALVLSTAGDGEEHRGFIEYEMESQLHLISSESINQRLGNQHIHTVTVKHDGPVKGDSIYSFDSWMHAIQSATEEAANKTSSLVSNPTTPVQPTTFKELRKSKGWKSILRLLEKTGRTVTVAESEAFAGSYSAVVLRGSGFQIETGKAGMSAAYTGGSKTYRPIKSTKEVLERALAFSGPLSDDPPNTASPTEGELVANLLEKIEGIRNPKAKTV